MFPWRASSSVFNTVAANSSRSSRLVFDTRRWASCSALRRSAPWPILPMVSWACSSKRARACSVRRSSSFSLAVSRFSHSRSSSFSRRSRSPSFWRSDCSSAWVVSMRFSSSPRKRVTSRSRSLREARARRMMSSGMPRRVAISRPADLPGSPSRRRNVGASVSSSKPTEPLTTPGVPAA